MRLNEVVYDDAEPIEGYGAGFFRIGGKKHPAPVVTGGLGTRPWGGYEDTQVLLDMTGEVDVLFIGTGTDIAHIPAALRQTLEEAGVGVEVMSSPAACRTYNVLLSEGRRVAVALLPVE
ncbi:Mth938-like domain-containing protein [Marivita sp. S0852]|uniref:Mth938-like domain-containing protein n=1 Tax=Marivita sp. S0852 TaxID=3373893 RepID=UPI003981DACE